MYKFRAVNYSMGREMASITYEAASDAAGQAYAEKNLPGKHAQAPDGKKVSVIGVFKEPYKK